ncbi:MAG: MAPEG family protein [Burkholderiales bacterium]|nr:MAPEG family protein [Burkholderiales bacterium]MDP2241393.1 MAPEG family protein [Burkholderiales bacterium]
MHDFRWPALITLGVVLLLFAVAGNVGRARGKYKVRAPATTGDPAFERAFRVQMNTLESAVAFLPVLWLFAAYVSGLWSAVLGAVWLAARVWYAITYQQNAAKRGPAFGLAFLVFAVLALGAAWGVVKAFI